jgi:hypothetical protein
MRKIRKISGTNISERRKRGAPPGNKNAVKHGFYSKALLEAERITLQQAVAVDGVDEEIALLRYKLAELLQNYPDRIDLQVDIANTIARLVRTRYQISKEQKKSLKEAIAKVLTELALPLGIGVGIKVAGK